MSDNLGDDWIRVAGHERSESMECRPFLQRVNEMGQVMRKCLMPYANNKGADQHAHPHSLISTFVVRCLGSIIFILLLSKVSRF